MNKRVKSAKWLILRSRSDELNDDQLTWCVEYINSLKPVEKWKYDWDGE
jgi:hypothetical protein